MINTLRRWWYRHKFKDSQYHDLFSRYRGTELVSLDCETTSLDPHSAELVTIAATRIQDNRILTSQSIHLTLRAPASLDAGSVAIHRIRHQDLNQGLEEGQALEKLLAFIGNRHWSATISAMIKRSSIATSSATSASRYPIKLSRSATSITSNSSANCPMPISTSASRQSAATSTCQYRRATMPCRMRLRLR